MSHPQDSDPRLVRLPPLVAMGTGHRWMLRDNPPGTCPHGEAHCDDVCTEFDGFLLSRPLDGACGWALRRPLDMLDADARASTP